ncbi:permease [Microbacterium amylolyticum]|uniref:permease n=1 Tax=Microbacterium amylolyticum TaxID=936337 RepID=UPI0013ECE783|nr:permease [Microbacterium amylolyticum]
MYGKPRGARRNGRARAIWTAIGIGALLVAATFAAERWIPQIFDAPLPDRAQDGLTLALSVLIESMPFVALGVFLSIVIQVWVPAHIIHRLLPKRAWARRMVMAGLGMLIPVCECGNVPFARGLMMRGLTPADTLAFLVAAPIVNPIVIITTHQAFGWSDGILVARILGGYVVALLIGWLYSRYPNPEGMLTEKFQMACDAAASETGPRWRLSLAQFVIELRAVMPALIIGSAIAGAVQVMIPRSILIAIGANPVLSVVAMMLLALTVAICSNVDSFFALSFASTFTTGSLVAFLIVGPIVDVKMIALLRTTFTTRVIAGLTTVTLLFGFAVGVVMNLVL